MGLSMRFALLAIGGLISGAFANYLIYSWAYFPRHISPWAPPPQPSQSTGDKATAVPPRRWTDRIPVFGWFGLRRESPLHGTGFWVRPLLVEIGCAAALPALYWYYTQSGGLLPDFARVPAGIASFSPWAHSLFFVHAILFVLMVAATFIDFDEQTIPDIITLPGTLIALVISTLPWQTFLPSVVFWNNQVGITETTFNIPWPFAAKWTGASGLWLALAIWATWIFALTDRHLVLRHGPVRAIGYLIHGIRRRPETKPLLVLGAIGTVFICAVWTWGIVAWAGLLSSLIGLAVGGGTVWAVRIVASAAMRQEAMGFGDVTLMAMIGAFVGWQAAIAGFFLAPPAAILIVIIQFIITRKPAVPFGPYLCTGTAIAVVFWDLVWNQVLSQYAMLGALVIYILVGALVAMGALLMVWGAIKRAIFAR
jgi:prepilin signal peptidase PulO-like enzyme (type II secretory pathway)